MAQFPALPLWTDAYLGDTTHLTTIEHGAYFLLLMAAWRSKDQSLPDDDKLLARFSHLTAGQWARIRPILEPFFDIEDGVWRQGRLTDEWMAVRQRSHQQSDKAKARWLKTRKTPKPQHSRNDASISIPISIEDTNVSSTPLPPIDAAVADYNAVAVRRGLPTVQKLTEARKRNLIARLNDCGGLEGWVAACRKLDESRFCHGNNDRGWKADFDFMIREASFVKLMEGKYDNHKGAKNETTSERIARESKQLMESFRQGSDHEDAGSDNSRTESLWP